MSETRKPSDNRPEINRHRHLQAIKQLESLLDEAIEPAFRGTVGVELSAKDGRLSEVKATRIRFGSDESSQNRS